MEPRFAQVEGGVTAAKGFFASGVSAGLKKSGKPDVALIAAARAVPSAVVTTTNSVVAAPVIVTRESLASGLCRAIVVNAGNANACTGARGLADARETASALAGLLGCAPGEVAVASTGVIGVPMPMQLLLSGVSDAYDALSADAGGDAAAAIMTTDTFPKECAVIVEAAGRRYTVGGMAKGSGMIQPNMATMLAFVTTDAPFTPEACAAALKDAVVRTFNRITVDSDTSTNDMCLLMASGDAGGAAIGPGDPAFSPIAAAVETVCGELARMVVRDGEGATKLIAVTVGGAETEPDALAAAFSIANSPLFKAAVFGGDANWGRVAQSLGKSSASVDPGRFDIVFAGILTCKDGTAVPFDEDATAEALSQAEVEVEVDLHLGEGEATVWTCDLTYDYVRINADYRS
ncbi:MAG TPA: bifunctional glutamate N-acetyltransferase/amino-acid acetyltransferase ArgJ [Coriobacteriia bacterium]|jgi:glutamate N-acetyltransferase/amino-acid N-acetyltransferase